MDLLIRPVTPAEYDTLAEITAQAYLQDGLLDFGESDEYLGELKDVAKRAAAAEVLVAVEKGRLLGGVTFVPSGGPMADIAGPGEAEIRMLAVAQGARGRGAGEALVRACVDRARATAAAYASSCRPNAPCTAPTASTNVWASSAHPSGTGIRSRPSPTSLSSPTS
jgi:ribosomal protein S18 acetylase RimI-like enzyme